MNEKVLEKLIALFEGSSLHTMEIEENQDGWKVRLERGNENGEESVAGALTMLQRTCTRGDGNGVKQELEEAAVCFNGAVGAKADEDKSSLGKADEDRNGGEEELRQVKAPIVGVFYAAPSPDATPFVKVGQQVQQGDTLCLIEAMKMMNELKAPVSGVVRRIFGQNGELVEFDQVLYEISPC